MAQKNIIKRIISSPLVQTILIYISGGWIALEMTDYFINKYDLNERISDVISIILLIGLPIAIFLAWFLSREKEESKEEVVETSPDKKSQGILKILRKKPWFSIPVTVVLILLIITGIRSIHRQAKIKWAKEEALQQIQILWGENDCVGAFHLCQQVRKFIPDDPQFLKLDARVTRKFTVLTDPEGVDVFYKEYRDLEGEWELLGTSPIDSVILPSSTMYRCKLEKHGYDLVNAVLPTNDDTLYRTMHESGKIPDGMVYVEGINEQTTLDYQNRDKHGFFIDKYEVSNKQFKEFMDQGGYQNTAFWQNDFMMGNEILSFEEAMEYFIDATGRPGPATWEAGDYPDGQEDYPVNGISWYEAAAYAAYTGKTLPTLSHWRSAAGLTIIPLRSLFTTHVVPLSNMKGIDPEPVGNNAGVNCYGTYDMAGNVSEWCWNESFGGRIIMGGAWDDAIYHSIENSQLPAFDRSPKNGFRCALYLDMVEIPQLVFQPVEIKKRGDLRKVSPVSDVEFEIFKKQYRYDEKDLNSEVEYRDEKAADWTIEKVSFDAAYEHERVIAYLFIPKEAVPPYQTIIYFPTSAAIYLESILEICANRNTNYLLKNGRAVMFPIYKGTFERRDGSCYPFPPPGSHLRTECFIKRIKDLSRSIDYLQTREDIDTARLCYLGDSWGGLMGAVIPAVENRIKISVLLRGGLASQINLPEIDWINYVGRIYTPVLMLNGRYDMTFPYESLVKPMYDLLGTPDKDKKLVLYETGHFIPSSGMIKEVLNWLDKYFGPVN